MLHENFGLGFLADRCQQVKEMAGPYELGTDFDCASIPYSHPTGAMAVLLVMCGSLLSFFVLVHILSFAKGPGLGLGLGSEHAQARMSAHAQA